VIKMERLYSGLKDPTIANYIKRVHEEVVDFLREGKGAIVAAGNQSRLPAWVLRSYLNSYEIDTTIDEMTHHDNPVYAPFKHNLKGRKIIVVGDPRENNGQGSNMDDVYFKLLDNQNKLEFESIESCPVERQDIEEGENGNGVNSGVNTLEIERFVSAISPRVREYLGNDPGAIVAMKTGGTYFGMGIGAELILDDFDITYSEATKEGGYVRTRKTKGKKVIATDDRVNTGSAMRALIKRLDRLKEDGWIMDYRTAVEVALIEDLADWTIRDPNEEEARGVRKIIRGVGETFGLT